MDGESGGRHCLTKLLMMFRRRKAYLSFRVRTVWIFWSFLWDDFWTVLERSVLGENLEWPFWHVLCASMIPGVIFMWVPFQRTGYRRSGFGLTFGLIFALLHIYSLPILSVPFKDVPEATSSSRNTWNIRCTCIPAGSFWRIFILERTARTWKGLTSYADVQTMQMTYLHAEISSCARMIMPYVCLRKNRLLRKILS